VTQVDGSEMPTGPLGYTEPPDLPAPLAALLQLTEGDMQDMLGVIDGGEEIQPNVSGKAIELIQTRSDANNFIFMDNMAQAVKRAGEIWLGMARELYVEEGRAMKTLDQNNTIGSVTLAEPMIDPETTRTVLGNDLTQAKYDTLVTVGPSSVSRRAATVRSLVGMMQFVTDPETQMVLSSMAIMNMEGEGLQDTRDFFRGKLLAIGAVKPTPEEEEEMAAAQEQAEPDAAEQLLRAEAEKSISQAELNRARVGETEAKTVRHLAEVDNADKSLAIEAQSLRMPQIR
jgi:hypothetical protein